MTYGYDSMDRGVSVLSELELAVYAERAAIAVLCEMVSDKARAVGRDFLDEVPAGGRAVDGRRQDECGGRVVDAAAAAENEADGVCVFCAGGGPNRAPHQGQLAGASCSAPARSSIGRLGREGIDE